MIKYERLLKFLGKKIIRFAILLIFVILLSFWLIDMSPINPVKTYISNVVISQAQIANLEAYWGVNEPITTKMANWLGNIIHGDLGTSLIFRTPVIDVIKERFLASLTLMLSSWILSGVLGFILGAVAGYKKDTVIDKAIKLYCYILQSAPTFWIALIIVVCKFIFIN